MLLPWKQFRPSATHGTVYQLSFTYRLAGRVRRRSVHASESTASELGGGRTFTGDEKGFIINAVSGDPTGGPTGGYPPNAGKHLALNHHQRAETSSRSLQAISKPSALL